MFYISNEPELVCDYSDTTIDIVKKKDNTLNIKNKVKRYVKTIKGINTQIKK